MSALTLLCGASFLSSIPISFQMVLVRYVYVPFHFEPLFPVKVSFCLSPPKTHCLEPHFLSVVFPVKKKGASAHAHCLPPCNFFKDGISYLFDNHTIFLATEYKSTNTHVFFSIKLLLLSHGGLILFLELYVYLLFFFLP